LLLLLQLLMQGTPHSLLLLLSLISSARRSKIADGASNGPHSLSGADWPKSGQQNIACARQ